MDPASIPFVRLADPLRRYVRRTPRLRRRSLVFASGLLLALVTGWLIAGALGSVAAEAARWGEQRAVVVVTRPVAAGAVVDPGDVVIESRPTGLVPAGAMEALPEAGRARVDLIEGEVLVGDRLAGSTGALSARLGGGRRAVAVSPTDAVPPLTVGDRVEVWAPAGAAGPARPGETAVRATAVAEVLDVGPTEDGMGALPGQRSVTLAVDEEDVAGLTGAALLGKVALVPLPA